MRAALAAHGPPMYERPAGGLLVDAFEPAIPVLLTEFPDMPATGPCMTGETRTGGALRVGLLGPGGIGTIGHERTWGDFVRAVNESGATAVTLRDGLEVVRVVDAVYRADAAGARS